MAKTRRTAKKKEEQPLRTPKEEKLFENLLRTTTQFIEGKNYSPQSDKELADRLHITELHIPLFKEILAHLVREGVVRKEKGLYLLNRIATTRSSDLVTGTIKVHPRGFGFVKPLDASLDFAEVFIPKHVTLNAVDGDTVDVQIGPGPHSPKGPEGRVVAIVKRGRTHLAGIVTCKSREDSYVVYAPMLGAANSVIVESGEQTLRIGDRIVMRVVSWGDKEEATRAKLANILGHIDDASCDVDAAIEEYELRKEFPAQVVKEAEALGQRVTAAEIQGRDDFRKTACFTIDPDTAKDFDDAVSLTKDRKGHYHLSVHIADVSHYVKPGSQIDLEAKKRCNSTYFPGRCIPMLPEELSNNLCSLKPNVNRLTISVIMHLDPDGQLVDYSIHRSVIKSAKRFTYKEAKAVLDGKVKSPYLNSLKLMIELCGHLKRQRYERGSVEFGLPELVVLVDEKGYPTGTDYVVYDITHQLIEEFMLKANELVAQHLTNQSKGVVYRVHDEPAEENMKDFSALANAFGFYLSPIPTAKEIQKLFDDAMKTPYGQYLATSYIRRMRLAEYSPTNIGHFGLNLTHYCHFTSPIRRYVDLVIHRALFQPTASPAELGNVADDCSEQERISAKAENNVVLLKKLRLLKEHFSKTPYREYEAIITRVKPFGIYFEIMEFMMEGFIHVSDLGTDFFDFDEARMVLKGSRYGAIFKAGNRITVILKEVELITLNTRWDLVLDTSTEPQRFHPKNLKKSHKERPRHPKERASGRKDKHAKKVNRRGGKR